jgi:D-alanyl-D-alanine carboxypeptidase/D-alanyl-D-alanine-endopeptidase (penicillin-binding protein 4)
MRRLLFGLAALALTAQLVGVSATPVAASATTGSPKVVSTSGTVQTADSWRQDVLSLVHGLHVSVSVRAHGTWLLRKHGDRLRTPASNEKLLLSMALLKSVDSDETIPLRVSTAGRIVDGVVRGNLWLVGHGDPEVDRHDTGRLAKDIAGAGIRRVRGSVNGDTGPFARDDWAPGWKSYFPTSVIPLPTALTYQGNVDGHGNLIRDPERRAATALTRQLEDLGVRVAGKPRVGEPPEGLHKVATTQSAPLSSIMRHMDHASINFDAEVLGKYLGQRIRGAPGTIAKGASAIRRFASARNVSVKAYDSSGLSYSNRVTSDGIVRLLRYSSSQSWARALRAALPAAGQGTLRDRLNGITVRAKTGSLSGISALSGWVRLDSSGSWAEFSILSRGMAKADAVRIEDKIVRLVARNA